jgi:hypothetical protein
VAARENGLFTVPAFAGLETVTLAKVGASKKSGARIKREKVLIVNS